MTAPVFISYSSKDEEAAETICAELENRDLKCWIAARDVDPGENYQEAIVRAIRAAKVMVLIFTTNANNSEEIKNEVALASQFQLVVIPVRVEDVVPNDALKYALATRQWIDLFRDWKRAIDRLAARISALISPAAAATHPPPVAPGPEQPVAVDHEIPRQPLNADRQRHRVEPPTPPATTPRHVDRDDAARHDDKRVRNRGFGLIGNMVIGIVGAAICVVVLGSLGVSLFGNIFDFVWSDALGAGIALALAGLFRRG
jgi:uncharacterized membrane protein YeaQ/YmgE (transglycosylase-associated protein family)